jgi:hypothetical protein
MAWSSMASPTLFAVVGDALPKERRALGFTVQSILRRIPIVVAPMLLGPQPRNHASRAYRRSALERDPGAAVLDGRRDRYRRRARIHICR